MSEPGFLKDPFREYRKTTPERLAEAVLARIVREVSYPPVAADGADNAARLLCSLLPL